MSDTYLRSAFKNWISFPGKASAEPIPGDRIDAYVNALKFSCTKLIGAKVRNTDLFSFTNTDDFAEAKKIIEGANNFTLVDKAGGGTFSDALNYYSKFLEEITLPACWLLASNPKTYDIIPAVQELSTITWRLDQKDRSIKKNDKVYLWVPGVDGGIVASGTILSRPEEKDPLRNDPYVLESDLFFERFIGVDIRLDRRFTNPLISRNLLIADNRTQTLEVLNFPGSSCYSVTSAQEDAIEEYIEGGHYAALLASASEKDTEAEEFVAPAEEKIIHPRRYWIFSPVENPKNWEDFYSHGYIALGLDALGDLKQYPSRDSLKQMMKSKFGSGRNYKHLGNIAWQFTEEMHIGDIVYFGSGAQKILGRGIIKSDYTYDATRKVQRNVRSVAWTSKGEWLPEPFIMRRALTDITPFAGYCRELEEMVVGPFDSAISDDIDAPSFPSYGKEDFLKEAFFEEAGYDCLRELLMSKKNIILTGAPGVGKTFIAERLAYSIIGEKDSERVRVIQFHSGYNYDNFVMGYRKTVAGDVLTTGVFYDFCKEAEPDDKEYFLIIDDIGRGNLSAVLGDVITLLGSESRGRQARLLYRDEQFSIPENVYIIGTMNTSSDNYALTDFSLRRRFAFYEINPAFDNPAFIKYRNEIGSQKLDRLVKVITDLNKSITQDTAKSNGLLIGHSYFCNKSFIDDNQLEFITKYELLPLIHTYFSAQPDQDKLWTVKFTAAIKG